MKNGASPKRLGMILAAFALAGAAFAQTGEAPPPVTLKIGDRAPALAVGKWVKGAPIKAFVPGQVYVVEFWATWCGPCKVSIPHLTELQKKYGDKVTFTGVSVWEEREPQNEEYFKKVEDFVVEWGDKMAYTVAVDGKAGTMAKTWMEAAGQGGIPAAFIVNQEGKIAWIGHPMGELDEVLQKVLDGKFDVAAAKAMAENEAKEAAEMEMLFKPIQDALATGDPGIILLEVDKAIAKKPEAEEMLGMLKFQMLFDAQKEAELYAYTDRVFKGYGKDNAQILNQMSWTIIENAENRLARPDYNLAIRVAERAVVLSESKDAAILDTLAFGHFKNGNVKKAIEVQEKAVALLDGAEYPDEMKAEIRARLVEFKKKG